MTARQTPGRRPRDRPLSRDDVPAIKDAVEALKAFYAAKGKEPPDWWIDRIKRGLADAGIAKEKR